ncbi:MAG: proline--tRNA ligase [Parachlamydiales bacterium]|nr:proline--tRNA ligase [Parachlamydiales bacterium]
MAPKAPKTAITPTREEDYPEWYQQVVKAADLAENAPVRGCMVIKPWGYSIWEFIQKKLDQRIKDTGHENAYFPLFIPLSFLEKEASHVEGFAKECAVVTHHRLESKDGKLIPTGELEEPLVVRPTSEAIIGTSFSKWIQSHRDLPLLINQWANVVRWEMRTRLFLRTAEFLWQEGHTAHSTAKEAEEETLKMLEVYREVVEETLAMPLILGTKTEREKFPGAVATYTIEGMMQDRKALQMGTSHYLGQNFAKAFNVRFTNIDGDVEYAHMTSWGVTTRLIGGLVMVHSDDDGLRLPPKIAPKQVVIIPFITDPEKSEVVMNATKDVLAKICSLKYNDDSIRSHIDQRDMRGGEKGWYWVKKGVPIRIEIGMRDIESGTVTLMRRDKAPKDKMTVKIEELSTVIPKILEEIQSNYFAQAKAFRKQHLHEDIENFDQMITFFTPNNSDKPEVHGGFVLALWCGSTECEKKLDEHKLSIRCIPLKQRKKEGCCVICDQKASLDAIFAKSY